MANLSPISKRLREAREATGLSQKQLGIKAGIDEFSASARVNQYETGKHAPDYLTLSKLASVLKVPTAYFYAENDLIAEIISYCGCLKKTELHKILEILDQSK